MRRTAPEYGSIAAMTPLLWFFTVLGALCLWLGFANDFVSLPLLALFWPALTAIMALVAKAPKTAFLCGWLSSFAGGFAVLYWLYLPVTEVGGLHFIPGLCCAALIAACLALQGGVYALLTLFFMRAPGASHSASITKLPTSSQQKNFFQALCAITSLAICWYLLETASALISGFPWLALGGALSQWIFLIQFGDVIGVWATSALWLAAIMGLLFWMHYQNRNFLYAGIAIAIMLSAYGCWRLFTGENEPIMAERINALFVEGNIDQNRKWLPSFQSWTLNLYIDLTREGLAEAKTANLEQPLIIWPETALPFFFEKSHSLAESLRKAVAAFQSPLLFGAPGITDTGLEEKIYNRAFLLLPDGKIAGQYDKEHLVPFGEYRPQWLNFRFLDALLQGVGIYSDGDDASPLIYKNWRLGMLICYEGIFPWLAVERTARGANILVDISNDGWFHLTPAGRQHLYLTIGRCIENNRWLLRGTNTGISAIVDNRGRIRLQGTQQTRGVLLGHAYLLQKDTIYNQLANWLPWFYLALFPVLHFFCNRGKAA